MRKQIYCLLSFLWISCLSVSAAARWAINSAGGITWLVDERVPHEDLIEMSGLRVSTVLRYGVDANGAFMLNRSMVWPMLRTIPNNTHASLMRRFAWNESKRGYVERHDGRPERILTSPLGKTRLDTYLVSFRFESGFL